MVKIVDNPVKSKCRKPSGVIYELFPGSILRSSNLRMLGFYTVLWHVLKSHQGIGNYERTRLSRVGSQILIRSRGILERSSRGGNVFKWNCTLDQLPEIYDNDSNLAVVSRDTLVFEAISRTDVKNLLDSYRSKNIVCRRVSKVFYSSTIRSRRITVVAKLVRLYTILLLFRYGRRTILTLTTSLSGISGLIHSFSVNYWMFLAFEFIDATVAAGIYSAGFILGELITRQSKGRCWTWIMLV